jgi:hypothetical protein
MIFKKFKLTYVVGLGALALMLALNLRHAHNDYGILDSNLPLQVLAQTNSSGNGSSGSDSSGNGGSSSGGSRSNNGDSGDSSSNDNPNPGCWQLPNNHNGGNPALYCNKYGDPDFCTLKKYIDTNGKVEWSEKDLKGGFTYTGETTSGLKEKCPDNGFGCTVYECRKFS